MANTVKVEIQNKNGIWKEWENVSVPVKYGTLLDEQLDFATVNLIRIKKKEFKPLTRARLTITSTTDYTEPQKSVIEYFIANDDFYESPVGSGAYNHELTLIELTKFLECFPLETLCFTNPTGNRFIQAKKPEPTTNISVTPTASSGDYTESLIKGNGIPVGAATPSVVGTSFTLQDLKYDKEFLTDADWTGTLENGAAVKVKNKNRTIVQFFYSFSSKYVRVLKT
jgi:hypothetical protein